MKKIIILVILLMWFSDAFAAPAVTNCQLGFKHDDSITIRGSGFGTKSPAAPLLWDPGKTNPTLSTNYDNWLPGAAQQGADYTMQYRAVGYRSVTGPHARSVYYLTGAHACTAASCGANTGYNVGIGKNITSYQFFVSYYYRIDPSFDESVQNNMKEISLSNTQANFYPSMGFGYVDVSNDTVPDINYTGDIIIGAVDSAHCGYWKYTENGNELQHNNAINAWVKMQWVGDQDATTGKPKLAFSTYPDNRHSSTTYYGSWMTTYEYSSGEYCGRPDNVSGPLAFIGLGGYAGYPRSNNGVNSFRYFTDVYIDVTRARVMLGNNATYSNCTILEPQIPNVWTNTSITFTVNRGGLSTGSAYLFVVDSNNEVSASYEIKITN